MKNLKNSSASKNNPTRKVKLSQCMIVKNEEKNIKQALTWAKDIAFEQIVVDTGSTDRTVEIAEQMGAKVFHYEWNDDFASAKNFALEQATGNWIAFLDADEYFSQKDAQQVLNLIKEIHSNVNFPTIKIYGLRTTLVNIDNDGSVLSVDQHDRIFINSPRLRYKNRIHECLALNGTSNYLLLDALELTIFHTGYSKESHESSNKVERNIGIIKKEIEDNPDNIEMFSYLAESLFYNNQLLESEEACFKAINSIAENGEYKLCHNRLLSSFRTLMIIMTKRIATHEEIINVYTTATSAIPNHPDFDFQLAQWMFDREDWAGASQHYLKSLNIFENNKNYDSIISSFFTLIYSKLAICFQNLNDFPQTVKYATLSLSTNKYQESILTPLIEIFNSHGFSSSAEEIYAFLSKIYKYNSTKDKLFIMKCAKSANNESLYQLLFSNLTPEEQNWLQS